MIKRFFSLLGIIIISCPVFAQYSPGDPSDTLQARQSNLNALEYVFDEDEIPESMNQEMEDLLRDYNAQHYLFVDSDCVQMSEGPQFTKEETIERLRKMPTLIEMPWNEVVQNYIDRYSQKLRRHVSLMLGAQNLYMQIFEEALETYGLPLELRYLPVIESALNPNAVSHAGAGGLWQFMVATGQRYGLRVTSCHCSLQRRTWQHTESNNKSRRITRLLGDISVSADRNTRICTSIHCCQLYHDILPRLLYLPDEDDPASTGRHHHHYKESSLQADI